MRVLTIKSKKYGTHECFYDEDDHDKIKDFIWCVVPNRGTFYAMTRRVVGVKKYKTVRMHQLIIDAKPIDHKNGNGLDNRKCNLRAATNQQNNFNTPPTKRNKSGFKGVYKTPDNKYIACIRVSGKLIHGGTFRAVEDAARKYNELARVHHGEFAWLNPIQ